MDITKKQVIKLLQEKIFMERDLKRLHFLAQQLERLLANEIKD